MDKQDATTFVHDLYHAVDRKDVGYLSDVLAEQCRFRLGNNPEVINKGQILEGNRHFFESIKSMSHSIEEVVFQAPEESGAAKVNCYGSVYYERLDGSNTSAVFATHLQVEKGLITDYLVFADLSAL
ncbi:nuclear transport factor 2 family protein [Enterovibrio sp. ZSDZ35]|uniref:Nuclear transport factor 2 family protein n=1 Tax=Enterovibrio qingdaonensis TaxID=2899818 RepID=A0ABT5QFJ4_9GAMM|nr:nuclear transport factor 2 family protein [Enterovibrio sp. ZSDZ35]MDD1779751.1 nuclear transport factor 2 family protein [Enterovibrio sp. ZSDZ35]